MTMPGERHGGLTHTLDIWWACHLVQSCCTSSLVRSIQSLRTYHWCMWSSWLIQLAPLAHSLHKETLTLIWCTTKAPLSLSNESVIPSFFEPKVIDLWPYLSPLTIELLQAWQVRCFLVVFSFIVPRWLLYCWTVSQQ